MIELMKAGGVPMLFVLLLGVLAVVAAVGFAWRPDEKRIGAVRALSLATFCSVGVGTCSDLAAVGQHVTGNPEWAHSPDLHLLLLEGFAESMSPGILGLSLLTIAWLVMAVGHRRLAARS